MRDLLRLLRLWRGALPWLAAALMVSFVTALANLALMATAGWFVTAMAAAGLAGTTMNYFTPSAIIRAAAILRTGGRWLDRVVGHETTFRLLAATRTALFRRLAAIAPAGLADLRSGEVAARLKLDVDRLELVFLRLVAPLAVAVATGTVAIAVISARTDGALAGAVAALFAVAGLALPFVAAGATRAAGARVAERTATLRRRVLGHLEGLGTLLVVAAERRDADALVGRLDARIADERRVATGEAIARLGQGLAADLGIVGVLALGAGAVAAGRVAGPDLTLVLLLVSASFEVFAPVATAAGGVAATLASLRRLFALWDRAATVEDPTAPRPLPDRFDLVVEGVRFTHSDAAGSSGDRPILDGVDLVLPEGAERVITGPSGSGKSTLVDLLVRVHDPDAGEIRLGGVPIAALRLADLRARIAVVPQRPHVFATTIAGNLRSFAPAASDEALWAALREVELAETVARMPAGLATFVGHGGARLSGGEIRRLAVARALLRSEARIVVLDEPTEGLDGATAAAMMRTVRRVLAGRSLLVVSHRESEEPSANADTSMGTGTSETLRLAGGRLSRSPPRP